MTEVTTAGPAAARSSLAATIDLRSSRERRFATFADRAAPAVFLLPAVVAILALSIFPLIVSAYLSLTRFKLVKGGFTLQWIGLFNYEKLLFGSQQFHLLGDLHEPTPVGWVFVALVAAGSLFLLRALSPSGHRAYRADLSGRSRCGGYRTRPACRRARLRRR